MNAHQVFLNSAGRLRSGWRLLIFTFVYVSLLFLLGTIGRVAYGLALLAVPRLTIRDFVQDLSFRLLLLTAAVIGGWICTRWLEGLPWRALGLWPHSGWARDLVAGSLIGIVTLAVAVGIASAGGGLRFSLAGLAELPGVSRTLISSAALFIVAALAEEALFRGYPLQTLTRAQLVWLGIFLTSVPFAAVHLRNPNVVAGFTFANTALAGVWFAVAYLRTRSLWLPLGLHWAWNWSLGSLFGLPVSGISISPQPVLRGIDVGPAWLTGGSYGIEGGVAGTIVLIASTIFLWRTKLFTSTEEMKRLSSQENPVARESPLSVLSS